MMSERPRPRGWAAVMMQLIFFMFFEVSHSNAALHNSGQICGPGFFLPFAWHACRQCSAGRYQPLHNTTVHACTPCPPGKFQQLAARSSCEDCEPGRFSALKGARFCTDCVPPFSSAAGSRTCIACKHGRFGIRPKPGLPPLCSQCAAGRYEVVKLQACHTCPRGKWSSGGTVTCPLCPTGRIGPVAGQRCKACTPGKYMSTPGGIGPCRTCMMGRYSSTNGEKKCSLCDAGRFGRGASTHAACSGACLPGRYGRPGERSQECYAGCAPGFAGRGGSASPACDGPCAPGRFTADIGSTTCRSCPAGKYQRYSGHTHCHKCPSSKFAAYSYAGNVRCAHCPSGRNTWRRGQDNCVYVSNGTASVTHAPPTAAPTPRWTMSPTPSWTPPPTPRLRSACNTVRLAGQLPGQPGAGCMGEYHLQNARVLGLPIYRAVTAGAATKCSSAAHALLYFNSLTNEWVVAGSIGMPPFVLTAPGSAAEYAPYNTTGIWSVKIRGGRAPVPWIRATCLQKFGMGVHALRPEHPLHVGGANSMLKVRSKIANVPLLKTKTVTQNQRKSSPKSIQDQVTSAAVLPVMSLHARVAIVSDDVTGMEFRKAVSRVLMIPEEVVHVEQWQSSVVPILGSFTIDISQDLCDMYTARHCDPRTGRLDLADRIARGTAFVQALVLDLEAHDKKLLPSDVRVADVHIVRQSTVTTVAPTQVMSRVAVGISTTAATASHSNGAEAAWHVSRHMMFFGAACFSTLWLAAAAFFMRERRLARERSQEQRLQRMRAEYDRRTARESSTIGGMPLETDWGSTSCGSGVV